MQGWVARREARRKVLIRAAMRAGGPMAEVCIRDISSRGLLVQANRPPRRGTYVEIVHGGQSIIGQVMWSKDRRFGIATAEAIDIAAMTGQVAAAHSGPPGPASGLPAFSARRAGAADLAQSFERSRIFATGLQFSFVAALGAVAAVAVADVVYESLARPFDGISAGLQQTH